MKKLLLLACIFMASAATANDIDSIRAEIDAERRKSAELDMKLRESDRNMAKTQRELVNATQKMSELETESDSLRHKMDELRARDAHLRSLIESNQANLREASAALLQIASSPASTSLGAGESLGTSILLAGIADRFDSELQESEAAIRALAETQRDIAKQQKSVDASTTRMSAQKSQLDQLLTTRSTQNAKLRAQSGASEARLKELAARAKSVSDLTDSVATSAAPKTASAGKFRTPVRGMPIRGFGDKSTLGLVSDGWHIRTRRSETVIAPDDAVVEFADSFRGRNKVLILNHRNGYYTVLAQLDELSVIAGQSVLAGEPIGRMGSDNPELYLELRSKKRALDPERFFDKPKGR